MPVNAATGVACVRPFLLPTTRPPPLPLRVVIGRPSPPVCRHWTSFFLCVSSLPLIGRPPPSEHRQPHSSPCPNRSRHMSPRSLTIWSLPIRWRSMSAQPRAASRAHSSLPCARGKMRARSWRIRLGMVGKSRRRTLGGTRQWPSGAGTVWSRL